MAELPHSSPNGRGLAGLALLAGLAAGCTTMSLRQVQAGGVVGTSGAIGGAIEGSLGAGAEVVGLEVTARTKFTSEVLSGAVGGGVFLATGGNYGSPFGFAHLGMHLLQLDVIDATPYLSAFSPYLTLGVGFCVSDCQTSDSRTPVPGVTTRSGDMGMLTLGLAAEYDVRFVRDGEAFFGLLVGFGRYSRRETRLPF